MNPKQANLVKELARLVARYEPEEFAELARLFRDGSFQAALASALDELAAASATQRPSERAVRPGITSKIAELRKTDPRRANLLSDLRARLQSGELLPTMPAIRSFSEAIGIKSLRANRREQAVSLLLAHLLELPEAEFETALTRASKQAEREMGAEYERWVALILNYGLPTHRDYTPLGAATSGDSATPE